MISMMGLKRLLGSLDVNDVLPHSYRGWHNTGVDYLCLLRDPRMTVKLYAFHDCPPNDLGLLVWPHDHRFSFEHYTLDGTIENVAYQPTEHGHWRLWDYKPRGVPSLGINGVGLQELGRSTDRQLVMSTYDIHSLRVDGDALAVQIQYHDERAATIPTRMFSVTDEVFCGGTGLYLPMSQDRAMEMVEWAKSAARR